MALNSSWVPDEDSQTLFDERSWLQGVVVAAIAYGITVSLYFLSFYLLMREKNRIAYKKRLLLLVFITISFLLGTLFMITLSAFTQMAFIDDRDYPGGPNSFENNMFYIPINKAGNAALVLSNWLSDALVVWRFKVIYQISWVPLWILMFFPCLMLAGSVAMGIMYLVQVSTTNPFAVTNGVNYTLPYVSLSLALNIILTIAIVLRLLCFRYRIVSVMGPQYGTQYASAAAMIIESAALYSTIAITFLVLYGIGNPVSHVFLPSLIQFQTAATLLIVFRVAQGKGWTENTAIYAKSRSDRSQLDNMQFASPGTSVALTSVAEVTRSTGVGESPGSQCILNNSPTLREVV